MASATESPARRRFAALAGAIGLATISTIVALELILQLVSLMAPDRSGGWRPGSHRRILCIGDSHTWGAGVEREESYPAQLQQLLDEREPGVYSVMNLGIPGMNTSQLRRRTPDWLSRHSPDVLIVWAGVNDEWNTAETGDGDAAWLGAVDRLLLRSRVYRLLRVHLHDRELETYAVREAGDGAWQVEWNRVEPATRARSFTIKHDGVIETIEHERRDTPDIGRVESQAAKDFTAIAGYAAAAGARTVLVTYPLPVRAFLPANRAMCRVARQYHLTLVDSAAALDRLPRERQEWRWAAHPGPAIYAEIVRDIARTLVADDGVGAREAEPLECADDADEQIAYVLGAVKHLALGGRSELSDQARQRITRIQNFIGTDRDLDALAPVDPTELAAHLTHPRLRKRVMELLHDFARDGGALGAEQQALLDGFADALESGRAERTAN